MYTANLPRNYSKILNQKKAEEEAMTAEINRCMHDRFVISSEVIMYSIEDVIRISGWSKKVVQRLFNNPAFPSIDFGKAKKVEAHALIEYLSVRHERDKDPYWKKSLEEARFRNTPRGGNNHV